MIELNHMKRAVDRLSRVVKANAPLLTGTGTPDRPNWDPSNFPGVLSADRVRTAIEDAIARFPDDPQLCCVLQALKEDLDLELVEDAPPAPCAPRPRQLYC